MGKAVLRIDARSGPRTTHPAAPAPCGDRSDHAAPSATVTRPSGCNHTPDLATSCGAGSRQNAIEPRARGTGPGLQGGSRRPFFWRWAGWSVTWLTGRAVEKEVWSTRADTGCYNRTCCLCLSAAVSRSRYPRTMKDLCSRPATSDPQAPWLGWACEGSRERALQRAWKLIGSATDRSRKRTRLAAKETASQAKLAHRRHLVLSSTGRYERVGRVAGSCVGSMSPLASSHREETHSTVQTPLARLLRRIEE